MTFGIPTSCAAPLSPTWNYLPNDPRLMSLPKKSQYAPKPVVQACELSHMSSKIDCMGGQNSTTCMCLCAFMPSHGVPGPRCELRLSYPDQCLAFIHTRIRHHYKVMVIRITRAHRKLARMSCRCLHCGGRENLRCGGPPWILCTAWAQEAPYEIGGGG